MTIRGSRLAQVGVAASELVDRAPQFGVELGVLQGGRDEAHDARQTLVVDVVEVVGPRVATRDEHPEEVALDGERGDADVVAVAAELGEPRRGPAVTAARRRARSRPPWWRRG